ncbi:MAG: type II secretion system minor pseudopilin GspK [Pseudomonadota bacterium]|nr:type II secretion system minor pseudopilin GspK [Pseudomonadota bacterium]
MIIVTLVATLATAMVWQQWRAVQVEAAERARTQAAWVLSGALDFAKLILSEDLKAKRNVTALTEPWATPLAESRLSTFLSVDAQETDDGPDAFLSGSIADAQARFNLMNLTAKDPLVAATQLRIFQSLCQNIGVEVGVAQRIFSDLQAASAASPSAGAPLIPGNVSQLAWLGVDPATIEALRPYVVVLTLGASGTPILVNANTASKEVLAAALQLSPAAAQALTVVAQQKPYQTTSAIVGAATADLNNISVRSDYFEVRGRLRLADRVLVERTLLLRNPDGTSTVLDQERVSTLEQAGP